jgi:hypothetical protein
MTISFPLLGLGALLLGLFFTLIAPPGKRAHLAFLDELAVFLLFVFASFSLWPIDPKNEWNWLLPGLIAGAIALAIIEFRRFTRYFSNLQYRMRHPYYWYSRLYRATRRRRRR